MLERLFGLESVLNLYEVENQWGGSSAPWHPGGTWAIGSRPDQHVVAVDVKSQDAGETLTGTMTYAGEGPIGFKGALQLYKAP